MDDVQCAASTAHAYASEVRDVLGDIGNPVEGTTAC